MSAPRGTNSTFSTRHFSFAWWMPIRTALLLLLALCMHGTKAQNSADLKKKRSALDNQIRTTTALIEQARKDQNVTQAQLRLLESQINAREQLIHTMNSELYRVDERIRGQLGRHVLLRRQLGGKALRKRHKPLAQVQLHTPPVSTQ